MTTKRELSLQIIKLEERIKELENAVYNTSEMKRFLCQGARFTINEPFGEKALNIYFETSISITPIAANAFKVNIGV